MRDLSGFLVAQDLGLRVCSSCYHSLLVCIGSSRLAPKVQGKGSEHAMTQA